MRSMCHLTAILLLEACGSSTPPPPPDTGSAGSADTARGHTAAHTGTDTGPLHPEPLVLDEAPPGHRAGNASWLRLGDHIWAVWEHGPDLGDTADTGFTPFADTQQVLLTTSGDPMAPDDWLRMPSRISQVRTKPSMVAAADGIYLLSNVASGDPLTERLELDLLLPETPLHASETWTLPLPAGTHIGRGHVAASTDRVAACFSETMVSTPERLRCDELSGDDWTTVLTQESGRNADHPYPLFTPDGLVVGFAGRIDGIRIPMIRFDDEHVVELSDGAGGEVRLAQGKDALHAVWRTRGKEGWQLHFGTCDGLSTCTDLSRWTIDDLTISPTVEGIDFALGPTGPVVSWSEGPSLEELRLQVAWRCGADWTTIPGPPGTTYQGNPALVVEADHAGIIYTSIPSDDEAAQLRITQVPSPCR